MIIYIKIKGGDRETFAKCKNQTDLAEAIWKWEKWSHLPHVFLLAYHLINLFKCFNATFLPNHGPQGSSHKKLNKIQLKYQIQLKMHRQKHW